MFIVLVREINTWYISMILENVLIQCNNSFSYLILMFGVQKGLVLHALALKSYHLHQTRRDPSFKFLFSTIAMRFCCKHAIHANCQENPGIYFHRFRSLHFHEKIELGMCGGKRGLL